MGSWYNASEDEWVEFEAPVPELWISENPVVGTLLGPDGAVVAMVTERPTRRLGFQGSDAERR